MYIYIYICILRSNVSVSRIPVECHGRDSFQVRPLRLPPLHNESTEPAATNYDYKLSVLLLSHDPPRLADSLTLRPTTPSTAQGACSTKDMPRPPATHRQPRCTFPLLPSEGQPPDRPQTASGSTPLLKVSNRVTAEEYKTDQRKVDLLKWKRKLAAN